MITETVPVNLVAEVPFYLSRDGEVYGPYLLGQAQAMLEDAVILPDDLIWIEGWEEWQSIGAAFGFAPPEPASSSDQGNPSSRKGESLPVESWRETGVIANAAPDGLSRRLMLAALITVGAHLVLFLIATLFAPQLFKIEPYARMAVPKAAPPLEVSFAPEEEATPPPQVPPSAPPPMLQPPPPLAPPIIPMPIPPPPPISSLESLPGPPPIADPALPSPPQEASPTAKRSVAKPRHRVSAPSVAAPTTPTTTTTEVNDARPSDYLDAPRPEYPPEALQRRQAGKVILRVTIDENGEPTDVEIDRSSGYSILDDAARKQVRDEYRFRVGDSRILLVPIDFQIDQ